MQLKTSDHKYIDLKPSQISKAPLLKIYFKEEKLLHLNYDYNIINKVLQYLELYHPKIKIEPIGSKVLSKLVGQQTADFIDIELDELNKLSEVASYLGINELYSLCCLKLGFLQKETVRKALAQGIDPVDCLNENFL